MRSWANACGEAAAFLRRRREEITPQEIGLPAGTRRRTPGLRRDEVAVLANMSANYYERLERGRGPQPSPAILAGLCRALRLSPPERDYLYTLAGHAPPPPARHGGDVDPGLRSVLSALGGASPAFITDDLATVVDQNDLHAALFGPVVGANMIRLWFTTPHGADEEETGQAYVADLRAMAGQDGGGPAAALVAELRTVSSLFARMWDEHRVSAPACATVTVTDRRVGRLDLDCVVVTSPLSRQRLVLLEPRAGTGSRRRLSQLAEAMTEAAVATEPRAALTTGAAEPRAAAVAAKLPRP